MYVIQHEKIDLFVHIICDRLSKPAYIVHVHTSDFAWLMGCTVQLEY